MMNKKFQIITVGILLLSMLMTGCGSRIVVAPPPATQAAVETVAPVTEPVTEPETEPVSEPVTEPIVETETEPATEPSIEPETEPVTEPAEPEVVLHSGIREDGTFDEGTLFMGDSLTYMLVGSYLTPRKLMGDAKHAAMCGTKVTAFFSDNYRMRAHKDFSSSCSEEFKYKAFYTIAKEMGEKATAIYFMWGSNYEPNATVEHYIEIVDYLLENCPNATIHMQLVPWGHVPYKVANELIQQAYDHFVEQGEQRVLLIDTHTAFGQNPIDGVHQGDVGNGRWYEALLAHAEANGLAQ